jgi:hypothetical protein
MAQAVFTQTGLPNLPIIRTFQVRHDGVNLMHTQVLTGHPVSDEKELEITRDWLMQNVQRWAATATAATMMELRVT